MIVALCGFMGCGKTTVGKILAEKMKLPFFDSDDYIEKSENMTVAEIFEKHGESYFRMIEKKCIKEIVKKGNCVLSLGGGALKDAETAQFLKKNAKIVFINTSFEMIKKNISKSKNKRPIVLKSTEKELQKLYNLRFDTYKEICSFEVSGNVSAKGVAKNICNNLK